MTGDGAPSHWFEALADHMGDAYLRYSFTKGTTQEVDFLMGELALEPGQRILDVGCGPGRHAREFARRGLEVVGVDISATFVEAARIDAPESATFVQLDARDLPYRDEFDAVISLCQGAFGLVGGGPGTIRIDSVGCDQGATDPDAVVMAGMARALRRGGRLAATGFSSYFMVRFLEDHDTFDVLRGVNHETTHVRDSAGSEIAAELWTSCFTPRELRLIAGSVGLQVEAVWSVSPGSYAHRAPNLDEPEFLLTAIRK